MNGYTDVSGFTMPIKHWEINICTLITVIDMSKTEGVSNSNT